MKKKLLKELKVSLYAILFACATFIAPGVFAQDYQIPFNTGKNASSVIENTTETLRVQYVFGGLQSIEVKTEKGVFNELILPQGYSVGELGSPKLPAVKNLIEIPFGAEATVTVKGYTVTDYKLSDYGINNMLFPNQPSVRKDQQPEDVKFEYNAEAYQASEFTRSEVAGLEVLGVMRGVRLGRLDISPVKYNPATGTIRVYNNIEVEVSFSGADKSLNSFVKASTFSPYFEAAYGKVLNHTKDAFSDHPDLTKYPIKMVVVADRMFEEALQPYFEWKTKKGFKLEIGYTDEIGSTPTDIKNYIFGIYNAATPQNPAPSFVLVVGDVAQVPASATGSASNGVTDLYYSSVDGDIFPDIYLGRLSAQTVEQLNNQLEKILYYEKYEFADPTYLDDVTLIAGADPNWNPRVGQATIQYGTQNYFNAAHGYATVNAYLNSYSGCYDPARIAVSMINYTAHCSPSSWADPSLSVSNVYAFSNANKYPLSVGNCCQSSDYSVSECIGEAWVRAPQKGAVAYIGSVPSTYWFEDFYWSVGAFPLQGENNGYVPTFEETTLGAYDAPFVSDYVSVAGITMVGNLAVTEVHAQGYPSHSSPTYYWQAYQNFGDPSMVIYHTQGEDNTVSHMAIVPIGMATYTVNALPGSYVAISKDGVLHGAALVDESGEVAVPIEPIVAGGDVTIVVTKPQYKPYVATVPAAALEGPYIVLDSYVVNDNLGNNNGQIDYTETVKLNLTAKNVGADPSTTITATVTVSDPYVTLVGGNTVNFGAIQNGTANTSTVENALTFEVSANVPDQYKPSFPVVFTDGTTSWNSNLKLTVNAPVIEVQNTFVLTETQGNSNGRLDAGETATATFKILNTGHAAANSPEAMLTGDCAYLTIVNPEGAISPIAAGEFGEVVYTLEANASAPEGISTTLTFSAKEINEAQATHTLVIGQMPQVTVGTGTETPEGYPFYNWYKANRSQMLYLESELGAGDKTITKIAFDMAHCTEDTDANRLPNFKIIFKPTTVTTLTGAYANTADGTVVFQIDTLQMPSVLGWNTWDIEDYVLPAGQNLIIEVAWGLLENYCNSSEDQFKVKSTQVADNRVVYGYDDNQASPTYDGSSNKLPNLFVTFAAPTPPSEYAVNFTVFSGGATNPVEGAVVMVGSKSLVTNNEGKVSINLISGDYGYSVTAEDYDPWLNQSFTLEGENLNILVDLTSNPTYDVTFSVIDEWNTVINDAVITFNGQAHAAGQYIFTGLAAGTYEYTITRQYYYPITASVEIVNNDAAINIKLYADGTLVEATENPTVSVYPNPTNGNILVSTKGFNEELNITLMNYQGQVVASELSTNASSFNFDLSGYAKGIYYIKVNDSKNVQVLRVVLQ